MPRGLDYRNLLALPEWDALLKAITEARGDLAERLVQLAKAGETAEGAFAAGQIDAYGEITKIAKRICKYDEREES